MKLIIVLCLLVIVCDARPRPFSNSRSGPPPSKRAAVVSKVSYEVEPAAASSEVSESSEDAEADDGAAAASAAAADSATYSKRQIPVAGSAAPAGESGFGVNDGQFKESTGASSREKIQAAVQTKHTFETRPVDIPFEDQEPQIIEVEGGALPLEIHFKSSSSRIKVQQSHQSAGAGEVEQTTSDEEPHRLVHTVNKPIISEVREVITPYRRVIQEIQPVVEEIHTIVAKGEPRRQFDRNQSKANRGGGARPVASPKERGTGAALSGTVSAGAGASTATSSATVGGGGAALEQKRYRA